MMKNTLILVPSSIESREVFSQFPSSMKIRKLIYDLHFCASRSSRRILCMESGIGTVHATMATTYALSQFSVDHVFLLGIAGVCKDSGFALGDALMASAETNLSMGDLEKPVDKFLQRIRLHSNLENKSRYLCEPVAMNLKTAEFGTSDRLISTEKEHLWLKENFSSVMVENMEGCAVAQTCDAFQIPFTEIRAVSNFIGDRDCENWNIKQALFALKEVSSWLYQNL